MIPALTTSDFPTLLQTVDPSFMTAAFQAYLARRYPALAPRFSACTLDQVRFKPGKGCRLLYRLHFTPATAHTSTVDALPAVQWLVGTLHPAAAPPPRDSAAADGAAQPWLPVDYWPEFKMTLQSFPHDPKVAHVKPLLVPAVVQQLINEQRAALGLPAGWQCERVIIVPVKYMPGKRCLLRYTVESNGSSPAENTFSLYSKTYSTQKSRALYGMLTQLQQYIATQTIPLALPQVCAHLPALQTIWQMAWPGEALSKQVQQPHWQARLPEVAQALAALHRAAPAAIFQKVAPAHGPAPAELIENVQGDVADIAAFFETPPPALVAFMQRFLQQPAQEGWSPTAWPRTPIHGAFKLGQVLAGQQGVAVIDFDDIAIGDPLYDVAEFVASLLILRRKEALAQATVAASVKAFLAAYAAAVPWSCNEPRLAWYCQAFLLAKVHAQFKGLQVHTAADFAAAMYLISDELPALLN
jgi:hypothetical protein